VGSAWRIELVEFVSATIQASAGSGTDPAANPRSKFFNKSTASYRHTLFRQCFAKKESARPATGLPSPMLQSRGQKIMVRAPNFSAASRIILRMDRSRRLSLVPKYTPSDDSAGLEARTDDELMLLARGGLDSAFSALIRRHQARTLRLAVRYLGRDSLAADVAQDTFVELFRALPTYQAQGKFSSYLYRVLLNRCHMAWRSAHAEQRALGFAAESVSDVDEVELLLREWRRDISVALGGLSEKLRSVVLLRYSAGLSYDEIAEALDVPSGTVKRRLFDALTKLRNELGGE